MGLLNKDLVCVQVTFSSEGSVANLDKIMVQGSVGILWGAYGHDGEFQIFDRVGGDRGGDRIFLPLFVRLAYQYSSRYKAKEDD